MSQWIKMCPALSSLEAWLEMSRLVWDTVDESGPFFCHKIEKKM